MVADVFGRSERNWFRKKLIVFPATPPTPLPLPPSPPPMASMIYVNAKSLTVRAVLSKRAHNGRPSGPFFHTNSAHHRLSISFDHKPHIKIAFRFGRIFISSHSTLHHRARIETETF